MRWCWCPWHRHARNSVHQLQEGAIRSPKIENAQCEQCGMRQAVGQRRAHTHSTESPHAAATPMMARRVRKWTVRCPAAGTLSTTVVFCSVSASFFGLSLVVLVVLV